MLQLVITHNPVGELVSTKFHSPSS